MFCLVFSSELELRRIPAARSVMPGIILALIAVLIASSAHAGKWKNYVVREGDTIRSIASFYGVAEHHLCQTNQLKKGHRLEKGRTLEIPAILSKLPNRTYEVSADDSITAIAEEFDISVRALVMANRLHEYPQLFEGQELIIPMEDGWGNPVFHPQVVKTKIRQGIRVDGGVVHFAQPGQSIFHIASAYHILARKIARANGLPMNRSVYSENRFFIPGVSRAEETWANVSPHLPVHFIRLRNNRQVTLSLFAGNGEVDQISRQLLSELSGLDGYTHPPHLLSDELLGLLQQVAQHFPGRSIVVISGYRPENETRLARKGRESKHALGMAIDFKIEGVSNWKLFKFISTLPNVGVGYYPRSSFIHMDYREDKVVWINSPRIWQYPQTTFLDRFGEEG